MDDPYLIDPTRLSAKPLQLEGTFKPADLDRLEESLAGDEGELRYRITAQLDPQLRRKTVSCIIEGFVFLTCQSSLEAFRHEISLDERLILVDDESQLPPLHAESDAEDYLVADGPLDIRDLVEDAVLLSLPMMPRKPGVDDASAAAGGAQGREMREASPFAALAGLKKQR